MRKKELTVRLKVKFLSKKFWCGILVLVYFFMVPPTHFVATNTEKVNSLLQKIYDEYPEYRQHGKTIEDEIYSLLRLARQYNYSDKVVSKHEVFNNSINIKKTFEQTYNSNFWGSSESVSGPGAQIKNTENIRKALPKLFEKYQITSILDAGCGDYNWMKFVDRNGIQYEGVDVVPQIVRKDNKNFKDENTSFRVMDITSDEIPKVDLIICRDCLQHLSYKNVKKTLKNFKKSGSRYLLVTNYPWTLENYDIRDGDFRQLNLCQKPFNLPYECLEKIKETYTSGNCQSKNLCLYDLQEIDVDQMLTPEKTPDHIPIAMSLDENYVYPTVVAITSAMENSGGKAKYDFYIMHPSNLSEKSKETLLSLQDKYDDCSINLIDMQNKFNSAYTDSRITTPAYYRLALSELLPNIDKIIWLDGDTIVLKDLTEMFNIDMDGYCYKAFLDYSSLKEHIKKLNGKDNDHYICDGVMLVNLEELRKENAVKQFEDFIAQFNSRLKQHDQTVINAVFGEKIGVLPAKFGLWNSFLGDESKSVRFCKKLISPERYTLQEILDARSNPAIVHFTVKPWKFVELPTISQLWWEYAEKTDVFDGIKQKYLIPDGTYTIASKLNSNKVLDIDSASKKRSTKLQLWDKNNSKAQKFKITYDKNGYYTIEALCSGKLIDVPNASKIGGKQLWQYDSNDTDAQKWYIIPNNDGTYKIISKCNGMNMDVRNAETKNGTPIQCCKSNGANAQKFRFIKSK